MALWVGAADTQIYQQMALLLSHLIFIELADSFEAKALQNDFKVSVTTVRETVEDSSWTTWS